MKERKLHRQRLAQCHLLNTPRRGNKTFVISYVCVHASLTISQIFALYRRVIASPVVDSLSRQCQPKRRNRVYTTATLFWLMISQRLQPPGTLAQTVARVRRRHLGRLLRRVKKISRRTGAYCRARLRAPLAMIQALSSYLTMQLHERLTHEDPRFPAGIFLIDGTTLTLACQGELEKKYPPGKNQHGVSHWPLLRMVVLHDARTGLALAPAWGPRTVSEQALAERVLDQLRSGALLLGDRNFGVFSIAYGVGQRQGSMILRLDGSVNLIWSLLITSFGPTHELMVRPCRLARAEAEPCEALRAERLGRSEGQRHPARAAPAAPVAIPVSSCGPPVCAGTGRTRLRSR